MQPVSGQCGRRHWTLWFSLGILFTAMLVAGEVEPVTRHKAFQTLQHQIGRAHV